MNSFLEILKQYGQRLVIGLLGIIGGYLGKGQIIPTPPPTPPPSTAPTPPPPLEAVAKPWEAIGKIQIGTYGCSATVIGKRNSDGSYDIATAAHCIPPNISTGVMKMDTGKQFGIIVLSRNATADVAWLRTAGDVGELPFAELADELPQPGEPVWHGGYGEHLPRNKESGTVVTPIDTNSQTRYWLSVSSGDSGGGIICNKDGKLLSTVCCTTQKNSKADVWGCSIRAIRDSRPGQRVNTFEWTPIEIPQMMP